jgi:Amt family ammonium transporter
LGGIGGVSLVSQLIGTLLGVGIAVAGGILVYGTLKAVVGIRLGHEQEFVGTDLSLHKIPATPDHDGSW